MEMTAEEASWAPGSMPSARSLYARCCSISGAPCKAYVVFARAVLDLAKFGFFKFIGNFVVPVSLISFGKFF